MNYAEVDVKDLVREQLYIIELGNQNNDYVSDDDDNASDVGDDNASDVGDDNASDVGDDNASLNTENSLRGGFEGDGIKLLGKFLTSFQIGEKGESTNSVFYDIKALNLGSYATYGLDGLLSDIEGDLTLNINETFIYNSNSENPIKVYKKINRKRKEGQEGQEIVNNLAEGLSQVKINKNEGEGKGENPSNKKPRVGGGKRFNKKNTKKTQKKHKKNTKKTL
jgi:hypothetical protein